MAGLKTRYKIALGVIGLGGALFAGHAALKAGFLPSVAKMVSVVPDKVNIATLGGNIQKAPAQSYELPAAPQAGAPTRTLLVIPWQATGSVILANNGIGNDCSGSLMQTYAGNCLVINRQDDYAKMADAVQKFATDFSAGNPNPGGAAYVAIMGGGEAAWLAGLKPQMEKLKSPAYPNGLHLVVFGVTGFSYGEDKCMGPDLGGDPNKAKGYLIAASPRDGDWDVCLKWASDNNIPVNSDSTIYDPGAINFVDTDGFQTADDKFISGACEDRDEARAGVKTGKRVHVCVNGVATWTPGDVTVMNKKGGIVTWASTKLYDQQMPAVLIGIKEDLDKNPAFVIGMLRAIDRASFQIRTTPDGVHKMAVAEAKVFGSAGGDEATFAYWEKYFVGYDSPDGKVRLGGSRVSTLAEVRDFMGLGQGTFNVYKGVYDLGGIWDVKYYPTTVPNVPKFEEIIDTSFITKALANVNMSVPTTTDFATAKTITSAVSAKTVHIEFDTGKATIRPSSRAQLVDIANSAAQTSLLIRISGFTDNTGDPDANVSLSRARAQAVANALTKMAPANFPANRLEVRGYGSDQPVANVDPNTPEGRAANRRVEIVLGQ